MAGRGPDGAVRHPGRRRRAPRPGQGGPGPHRDPGTPVAAPPRAKKPASVLARLTGNRLLSLPGAGKEVRRFTFDTRDSGTPLRYEAGDALGIRPLNSAELVEEWLAVTGLDAGAVVDVNGVGEIPVAEAFLRHLDLTRITPACSGSSPNGPVTQGS